MVRVVKGVSAVSPNVVITVQQLAGFASDLVRRQKDYDNDGLG